MSLGIGLAVAGSDLLAANVGGLADLLRAAVAAGVGIDPSRVVLLSAQDEIVAPDGGVVINATQAFNASSAANNGTSVGSNASAVWASPSRSPARVGGSRRALLDLSGDASCTLVRTYTNTSIGAPRTSVRLAIDTSGLPDGTDPAALAAALFDSLLEANTLTSFTDAWGSCTGADPAALFSILTPPSVVAAAQLPPPSAGVNDLALTLSAIVALVVGLVFGVPACCCFVATLARRRAKRREQEQAAHHMLPHTAALAAAKAHQTDPTWM